MNYICIAKCPELDCDESKRCSGECIIEEFDERYIDGCPCGNTPIWQELDCHYCNWAVCHDVKSSLILCYGVDGEFDHTVKDSNEAKDCIWFTYCDCFPKS